MMGALLSNGANARRQEAYRGRQIDAGRVSVTIWLDFETLQNLRALAYRRKVTLQETVEAAINSEWEAAGRP